MILIDDTEASLEFFSSSLIFARSVFLSGLSEKFILQKYDQFRCNAFYESESKYQIIKSCEERCMKFVAIVNPADLIISYFEVFVRFFCNFFYNLSKGCLFLSKKQDRDIDKREILLNLFISNFKKFCREVCFQSLCYENFEELFTILIRDVDYLSCYIRFINQNYIDFIEEKFKLWIKTKIKLFLIQLEKAMGKFFATLTVDFFVSSRNHYVHMGLNRLLHSIENLA